MLRIGHGYDLHRLEPIAPAGLGRPFILGGVRVPEMTVGPVGHSDGDVLYHAVTDALLGAVGGPGIGALFPDDDPANDNRDSADFLAEARSRVSGAGLALVNLDCTVVCERPKVNPIKAELEGNIARVLGVDPGAVNVKGKTHERVDAIGAGRAIEVHVVALLMRTEGANA